jgi:hypothetical protein
MIAAWLQSVAYLVGQRIIVEKRFAGSTLDRIAELAKELVALNCDVILAAGPSALAV